MASTSATTSGKSGGHKWAIVRHYQGEWTLRRARRRGAAHQVYVVAVLYSSDEHKQEGNRLWHDGKLVQHTFNGKVRQRAATMPELLD